METKNELDPEPESPVEGEVIEEEPSGELTLNSLAVREKGAGGLIATAKHDVLKVFREKSIAMTYPEDWILFKRPDEAGGQITGFLSDAGCKRVSPLWGYSITPEGGAQNFNVEKIDVGEDYLIVVRADAVNHTTGDSLRGVEGCRGSDEDFVKNVSGTRKLSYVRKAAFRNLYGNIIRQLGGLDSTPLSELQRVWGPLGRKWQNCPKGRGFGGAAARYGDAGEEVTGPKCPKCGGGMKLIKPKEGQKWSAFWGCLKGKDHCSGTVKDSEYQVQAPGPEPEREGNGTDNTIGENLGEEKNRLLKRIQGQPWEAETKKEILKAKDTDSLLDILTTIVDHERGNK